MSLAYYLLLSWFIWCQTAPQVSGEPFSVAPSFWHVPSSIECTLTCLYIKMLQQLWDQPFPENRSFSEGWFSGARSASKCIHCIWDAAAIAFNTHPPNRASGLLCVLRVILISVFIFKNHAVYRLTCPVPLTPQGTSQLPLVYFQFVAPFLMVNSTLSESKNIHNIISELLTYIALWTNFPTTINRSSFVFSLRM